MTTTVKRTGRTTEWTEVSKALELVRKDLRRDVKKLETQATTEREQIEKSLRGIVDVLEEGFTTAAKAVRDPQLRKDIADVGKAIRTALKTTPRYAPKATKPVTPKPTGRKPGSKPAKRARKA